MTNTTRGLELSIATGCFGRGVSKLEITYVPATETLEQRAKTILTQNNIKMLLEDGIGCLVEWDLQVIDLFVQASKAINNTHNPFVKKETVKALIMDLESLYIAEESDIRFLALPERNITCEEIDRVLANYTGIVKEYIRILKSKYNFRF